MANIDSNDMEQVLNRLESQYDKLGSGAHRTGALNAIYDCRVALRELVSTIHQQQALDNPGRCICTTNPDCPQHGLQQVS